MQEDRVLSHDLLPMFIQVAQCLLKCSHNNMRQCLNNSRCWRHSNHPKFIFLNKPANQLCSNSLNSRPQRISLWLRINSNLNNSNKPINRLSSRTCNNLSFNIRLFRCNTFQRFRISYSSPNNRSPLSSTSNNTCQRRCSRRANRN